MSLSVVLAAPQVLAQVACMPAGARRRSQFADAVAGGVVHRVGDRGCCAELPDLPDALDAERVDDVVLDLDQAREQVRIAGQDHRVVIAVRHEHRQVDAAEPLEQCMIRNAPRAGRVILRLAGSPRRRLVPVKGPGVHPPQCFLARLLAGRRLGEDYVEVSLRPGFRCADRTDAPGAQPCMPAAPFGAENQPADDGRAHQRDLPRDEATAWLARRIASFPADAARSAKQVLNELPMRGADAIRADARRFRQLVVSDTTQARTATRFTQGLQTRGPLELNLADCVGALS
jgi:hypothetical protein